MASRLVKIAALTAAVAIIVTSIAPAQEPLTLEKAIQLAESHSLGVASLRHDSLAASYDLSAARALRYPTLLATATSFYTDEVQKIELPFNTVELGDNENYQADMRVTFPLYAGGRISGQIGAQRATAEMRAYNLTAARLQNAYNTRKAYLGLMMAISAKRIAEISRRRFENIQRDVKSLYDNGLADSADIFEARAAYERAQRIVNERNAGVANAKTLLARLTGLDRDSLVIPIDDSAVPIDDMPEPNLEQYENTDIIPEELGRPELDAMKARAEAAEHAIGINKAGYLPSLSAFGGYTVGKPARDIVNKDWNDYWTVGLNLNWEFNLGMRAFRSVSSARESARAVTMARDDMEESIRANARVAYDNLRMAFENYAAAEREYEAVWNQSQIASERQTAGTISTYRLIQIWDELASAEQLFRSAAINFYLAETEYLYAIGSNRIYGGF